MCVALNEICCSKKIENRKELKTKMDLAEDGFSRFSFCFVDEELSHFREKLFQLETLKQYLKKKINQRQKAISATENCFVLSCSRANIPFLENLYVTSKH